MNVCLIGRGKLGRALARALTEAGIATTLIAGRRPRGFQGHDVYVIATGDAHIRRTAATLAPALPARAVVLHCAGARDLRELAPLSARGIAIGVFHPLLSFPSRRAAPTFAGATFTSYGDARAVACARKLARKLDARCVVLRDLTASDGAPAYHAAAALVANGAAALSDLGVRVLGSLGYPQRDAERALAALLASVAYNVRTLGVPRALTGPVVRGDAATVARHLRALGALDPALMRAYAALQPAVLESARAAGLAPERVRAIRRALRKTAR